MADVLTFQRITPARYAGSALSGRGALLFAGRWHEAGRPVVYAADSAALALLEVLAGTQDRAQLARESYVRVTVRVPVRLVQTLAPNGLPPLWQAHPHPVATQRIGTQWLASGASVALLVPSTLVPSERNVLLNPEHADWEQVEASDPEPFPVDLRLHK